MFMEGVQGQDQVVLGGNRPPQTRTARTAATQHHRKHRKHERLKGRRPIKGAGADRSGATGPVGRKWRRRRHPAAGRDTNHVPAADVPGCLRDAHKVCVGLTPRRQTCRPRRTDPHRDLAQPRCEVVCRPLPDTCVSWSTVQKLPCCAKRARDTTGRTSVGADAPASTANTARTWDTAHRAEPDFGPNFSRGFRGTSPHSAAYPLDV